MKNLVYLRTAACWALLLFVAAPTFSQPGRGAGGRRQLTVEDVKERVSRLADSLDMTAEQEKKVLEFEIAYFEKNQKMRENWDPETGDREAMREYMMKQREERDEKYAEVLTVEQMKKYRAMQDRRRQYMRQRMEEQSEDRGRGGGRD